MYDPRLYRLANEKGWKLPAMNNPFPSESWNEYWKGMEQYERDPSHGRPIPPHRVGRQSIASNTILGAASTSAMLGKKFQDA